MATQQPPDSKKASVQNWVQVVREQVESVRFGIVQITVYDSRVVHVERVEKTRFNLVNGETLAEAVEEPERK